MIDVLVGLLILALIFTVLSFGCFVAAQAYDSLLSARRTRRWENSQ